MFETTYELWVLFLCSTLSWVHLMCPGQTIGTNKPLLSLHKLQNWKWVEMNFRLVWTLKILSYVKSTCWWVQVQLYKLLNWQTALNWKNADFCTFNEWKVHMSKLCFWASFLCNITAMNIIKIFNCTYTLSVLGMYL